MSKNEHQTFSGRRIASVVGIILLLVFVSATSMWIFLLLSKSPLENSLSSLFPWPIACSARGCITTMSWAQQYTLSQAFAQLTSTGRPSPEQSLTSALRRHIVENAFLRSPVTMGDAKRYRNDILNVKEDNSLKNIVGSGVDEYDQFVIVPFLQQEALRTQYHVESTEELYKQLNKEHPVILLLFKYRWDKEKGMAVEK